MPKGFWYRVGFVVFLVVVSLVSLVPTLAELVLYPEPITEEDIQNEPAETDPDKVEGASDTPVAKVEDEGAHWPDWYKWWRDSITSRTLALGLDLQGGVLLRYAVDLDKAIETKLNTLGEDMRTRLGDEDGNLKDSLVVDVDNASQVLTVGFPGGAGKSLINKQFLDDNYQGVLVVVDESDDEVRFKFEEEYLKKAKENSLEKAVETIRKRVDAFGLANPSVRVEAGRHIVVELPGLSKSRVEEAERVISTTAVLSFKLVAPSTVTAPIFKTLAAQVKPEDNVTVTADGRLQANDIFNANGAVVRQGKDTLERFVKLHESRIKGQMKSLEIAYEKIKQESPSDPVTWRTRIVMVRELADTSSRKRGESTYVAGNTVVEARVSSNPTTNLPYVALKLNASGGDLFGDITKDHVGDQLAILMDSSLISDPVIRSAIPGGNVSIEMGGSNRNEILKDVNTLVIALNSGALPAPIRKEFKTLVGPSLGKDSIENGSTALMLGAIAVLIFMLVYYKFAGVVADVALILNLLFILAIMAGLGATLTLPGIAGIVLTVGMAVDANVIIFERIREEIRADEKPRKAVQLGYEKALWTILDANITTGIAALVLMNFGSGTVRGFAVTLLIGIICSVFTAVYVSRILFDWYLNRKKRVERLPI